MSYTVYGLREKGDREVRYVGFTRHSPDERLRNHVSQSRWSPHLWPLRGWLCDNKGAVEAFAISSVETEAEARAMEKVIIALCLRLNQRLLNSDHVPRHLRIVSWSPRPDAKQVAAA
jgi:hypothetical protein